MNELKDKTLLKYALQNPMQKRQIIRFIRTNFPSYVSVRDIIGGLYEAILQDGKLVGIATELNKIKSRKENK